MELQKKIYNFILDYWKLIKAYTPKPKDDDIATWDKLLEDTENLYKKYKDDTKEYQFFKDLIILFWRYLGKDDLKEV